MCVSVSVCIDVRFRHFGNLNGCLIDSDIEPEREVCALGIDQMIEAGLEGIALRSWVETGKKKKNTNKKQKLYCVCERFCVAVPGGWGDPSEV